MAILRSEDFLITTWVGDIPRKVIWNGDGAHELDLPMGWVIERHEERLRIRNVTVRPWAAQLADSVEFDIPQPGSKQLVELPSPRKHGQHRPLDVEIIRMSPLDPVYLLRHVLAPSYEGGGPKQLMQFYGERYYLARYRPVAPKGRVGFGSTDVFQYFKTENGYAVVALGHGVRIKTAVSNVTLPIRTRADLSEQAFFSATVIYGVHWWRYRMVPTPDSQPPIETAETEDDIREELRFKQSGLVFLVAFFIALSFMYQKSLHEKPAPKVVASVEIKAPKILPPTKEELKPKPPPPPPPEPPKVVEVKPEPPKPEPVKPEPKPKIAKAKKPKPHKMPTTPPPAAPEPPPPPVAKAEPEPPSNAGNAAAEKAKEAEAMKQQLIKSLGFISTSSKRTARDPASYDQKEGRFTDTPTVGGDVSKGNSLDKLVKDAPGDGNIRTNSSRTVNSNLKFAQKGKGLNDVQGKVSLGEIYSGNANLGDNMGEAGLSVSGSGNVSEGDVEKALAKYLQRFQFCYEKALLSDSSLGGKIVMQWTIDGGAGKSPKVLSSQMNNKDLHSCIAKVIKEIPFPKPKGGTVLVKKTFAFSSSTL